MINGERIYTVGLKYMYRIPVKKDDGKDLPRLWKFRVTRKRAARNAFWVNVGL